MQHIKIDRVDPEDGSPTYWVLYVDGQRVSDYFTFRKAWNAAKRINPDTASYELHPFDR